MKTLNKALLATAVSAAAFSGSTFAEGEKSFVEKLADGKASVLLRHRFESVAQDNTAEDALASTLKTRVTYTTGAISGFSGTIEFDDVSNFLLDSDYNAFGSNPEYSVVADAVGTDTNQAFVQYAGGGFTVKYGRQRILLDNQRYVGGVGWRQQEQTFDAITGMYKNGGLKITLAHIENRNFINNARFDVDDNLVNVQYKINDAAVLTGYGYFLSGENPDEGDLPEQDTIGFAFTGKAAGFTYRAELAAQETDAYEAGYSHLAGTYQWGPVKLGIGQEVIGADVEDSISSGEFNFRYGTNHAFQGWADALLFGAGGNGVIDTYASIAGKAGPVTLAGFVRGYSAFEGDEDLGSEVNFVAKGKAGPVGLLLKYANYSADDFGVDTQKIWFQTTLKF